MKTFKQHLNEQLLQPIFAPAYHKQSNIDSSGRFIKIMSDGSTTPYTLNDAPNKMDVHNLIDSIIERIVKKRAPWFGEPGPSHFKKMKKDVQDLIDGGKVHTDPNYNAWMLEALKDALHQFEQIEWMLNVPDVPEGEQVDDFGGFGIGGGGI